MLPNAFSGKRAATVMAIECGFSARHGPQFTDQEHLSRLLSRAAAGPSRSNIFTAIIRHREAGRSNGFRKMAW
jgi:hypothetical protein